MINIKYSQEAIYDIQNEADYIYLQSLNINVVEKYLHGIEKGMELNP